MSVLRSSGSSVSCVQDQGSRPDLHSPPLSLQFTPTDGASVASPIRTSARVLQPSSFTAPAFQCLKAVRVYPSQFTVRAARHRPASWSRRGRQPARVQGRGAGPGKAERGEAANEVLDHPDRLAACAHVPPDARQTPQPCGERRSPQKRCGELRQQPVDLSSAAEGSSGGYAASREGRITGSRRSSHSADDAEGVVHQPLTARADLMDQQRGRQRAFVQGSGGAPVDAPHRPFRASVSFTSRRQNRAYLSNLPATTAASSRQLSASRNSSGTAASGAVRTASARPPSR